MLGWLADGNPDGGVRLTDSGAGFADVGAQLAALVPDGGWRGLAARGYTGQNLAQSDRAMMMGDLDHRTGGLIAGQAQAVAEAHAWLVYEMLAVAGAFSVCVGLEAFGGPVGQQVSLAFAVGVCGAALYCAIDKLVSLEKTTSQHACELHGLTQSLTAVVTTSAQLREGGGGALDGPVCTAQPAIGQAPTTAGSVVTTPDIGAALGGLPGCPAFALPDLPSPGFADFGAPDLPVPPLAGLPRLGPSVPGGLAQLPTRHDLAGLRDVVGAAAAAPGPGLPKLATMARLAASAGQSGGLSAAANRISQLTNTAGQQPQTTTPLAQHDTA
ncbi:EspA/EspE family type VII secretion system effector, partial [Mycobacterium marinum]|uniref:EspA/EspE family type VII secretion system effector n=1 Tax=Mycobacterium marinum TaxID=1781 RepID=UPI0023590068